MATKIKNFSKSRLTNGAHAEFNDTVKGLMVPQGAKLGIVDQITAYEAAIRTEQEIINRQHGSIYTNNMTEADRVRDNAIGTVFRIIDAYATLPDAELSEAGRDLRVVIRPYRGIRSSEMMKQTAEVEGLLRMLGGVEVNEQAMVKLGLAEHIGRIAAANEEFKRLVAERDEDIVSRQPVADVETRAQRRTVDALYTGLCERIYAAALIGTTAQQPVAEELIVEINRRVDHYRAVLASERRTPSATAPDEGTDSSRDTAVGRAGDDAGSAGDEHDELEPLPFGFTDEE